MNDSSQPTDDERKKAHELRVLVAKAQYGAIGVSGVENIKAIYLGCEDAIANALASASMKDSERCRNCKHFKMNMDTRRGRRPSPDYPGECVIKLGDQVDIETEGVQGEGSGWVSEVTVDADFGCRSFEHARETGRVLRRAEGVTR